MHVNSVLKRVFNNPLTVGSGIVVVMLTIFFVASSFTDRTHVDEWRKQVNLVIRQMGHRLLLQAGDSTSRVLPVSEVDGGTFQLNFEKEFSFSHDSLVSMSQTLLPKTKFPSGYTLTVHDFNKNDIVYGFQFNNKSPDVVACLGRKELSGLYKIELTFPDLHDKNVIHKSEAPKTTKADFTPFVFAGVVLLLGVTLLIGGVGRFLKPLPVLGKFVFNAKEKRLLIGEEVITLTEKECQVLELLNNNFGELIPRETLTEKIWLNEGVITGRSLDMFVSKLRKKLSGDPELRITNVHGKGYKLESYLDPSNN